MPFLNLGNPIKNEFLTSDEIIVDFILKMFCEELILIVNFQSVFHTSTIH